jgi:hypothetical protein
MRGWVNLQILYNFFKPQIYEFLFYLNYVMNAKNFIRIGFWSTDYKGGFQINKNDTLNKCNIKNGSYNSCFVYTHQLHQVTIDFCNS